MNVLDVGGAVERTEEPFLVSARNAHAVVGDGRQRSFRAPLSINVESEAGVGEHGRPARWGRRPADPIVQTGIRLWDGMIDVSTSNRRGAGCSARGGRAPPDSRECAGSIPMFCRC